MNKKYRIHWLDGYQWAVYDQYMMNVLVCFKSKSSAENWVKLQEHNYKENSQ